MYQTSVAATMLSNDVVASSSPLFRLHAIGHPDVSLSSVSFLFSVLNNSFASSSFFVGSIRSFGHRVNLTTVRTFGHPVTSPPIVNSFSFVVYCNGPNRCLLTSIYIGLSFRLVDLTSVSNSHSETSLQSALSSGIVLANQVEVLVQTSSVIWSVQWKKPPIHPFVHPALDLVRSFITKLDGCADDRAVGIF